MPSPKPPKLTGSPSPRELKRAGEQIARSQRLTAEAPLRLTQGSSGFHFSLDTTRETFLARLTGAYTPVIGGYSGTTLYSFIEQTFDTTTGIPFDLPAGRQTYPPPPYDQALGYVPQSAYALEDNGEYIIAPSPLVPDGYLNPGPYVEMRLKGVVDGAPVYEFQYAQPLAWVAVYGGAGIMEGDIPLELVDYTTTITLAKSGTQATVFPGSVFGYLRGSIYSVGQGCYLLASGGKNLPVRPVLAKLVDRDLKTGLPVYYYSDMSNLFAYGSYQFSISTAFPDSLGWMSAITLDVSRSDSQPLSLDPSAPWFGYGPSVFLGAYNSNPEITNGVGSVLELASWYGEPPDTLYVGSANVASKPLPTQALIVKGATGNPTSLGVVDNLGETQLGGYYSLPVLTPYAGEIYEFQLWYNGGLLTGMTNAGPTTFGTGTGSGGGSTLGLVIDCGRWG